MGSGDAANYRLDKCQAAKNKLKHFPKHAIWMIILWPQPFRALTSLCCAGSWSCFDSRPPKTFPLWLVSGLGAPKRCWNSAEVDV